MSNIIFIQEAFLNESTMSRIYQHIENNGSFGVISPYRSYFSNDQNLKRYKRLKSQVRNNGLGFIEMEGGFKEESGWVIEKSLFIPNINKELLIQLGIQYDQYSVIYKNDTQFVEIGTNEAAGIGKILNNFVKNSGQRNLLINGEATKEFFSRLIKGSHSNKKYLFNIDECFLYEYEPKSFNEQAYNKHKSNKKKLIYGVGK